jgi:hypothetical protein
MAMAKHSFFLSHLIAFTLSGLVLCAGCEKTRPQQQAATPTRLAAPKADVSEVAALTHYYADLLARKARLPNVASRQGATPIDKPTVEGQLFSRVFSNYRVYLDLDSTSLLESVSIEVIPPPEDPNRMALQPPPIPSRLVRVGELRRQFGHEKRAAGPQEETHTYDFTYHPQPQLRPVTIQADIYDFKLTDSTMVERLLLLPTNSQ